MPIYIPRSAPTGVLRYEVLDYTSTLRDLTVETSPDVFVEKGSVGLSRAPADLVMEKLPFAAGSILRYAKTNPIELTLPIFVNKPSIAQKMTALDSLRKWFYTGNEQRAVPAYWRVTRPNDDAQRQVMCFYAGGLEGDLSGDTPTTAKRVVHLIGPEGVWTDIDTTDETYDASDVGDTLAVINLGDLEAFPIWTISGPTSSPLTLTNVTTGKALSLAVALLATDTLTIDTRPSWQRETLYAVTDQDGANFYSQIAAGGALWSLAPGQNNFTIAAGGTSGATSFGLSWLPRYLGALG